MDINLRIVAIPAAHEGMDGFYIKKEMRSLTVLVGHRGWQDDAQSLLFFPFIVSAVVIKYDPIVITNATLVKQVQFMFDNTTTPAVTYGELLTQVILQ